MKPPRLGLIVLILGVVAFGSYLLSNVFQKQTAKSLISYPSIKLSSPELSLPAPQASSFENFDEKNNLTKSFGDNLYQQIKQTENFSTDTNLPSEELVQKVINNSLADFQLVSTIRDSEIKISPDISREAKTEYLKTIWEISQKNYSDFSKKYPNVILDTYQNLDSSSAKRLTNIYKNLAADYLNTSVPADWVGFHKQLILYAKNAAIIYQAMASYSTDPIKGALAWDQSETLINSANDIQNIYKEKTKEIGFK
jgi:hypothetical protein